MTQAITRLSDIASHYDAIVFDQWGVLHNGSTPYPNASDCVSALHKAGHRLAVLSNSGKRAAPNADRIADMGFGHHLFECVMTSGEALWRDIYCGVIESTRLHAIERSPGDAAAWADGLDIKLTSSNDAGAILLMGLPDGAEISQWIATLADWRDRGLTIYCSNPDRQSPRADGLVISPGALAFAYRDMGGAVVFYGKPYRPVFASVEQVFGPGRYLMVGDSMEHDIAGAHGAGWDSLLIEGGLYADRFAQGNGDAVLAQISSEKGCLPPTHRIKGLC